MLSLIVLTLLALAGANPMPAATTSPAGTLCPVVNKIVTALKQQKPASAFCSSYLSIPIVTTTSTQTETAVETSTSSLSGVITETYTPAAAVTVFETPPAVTVEVVTTSTVTSTLPAASTVTSTVQCIPPPMPVNKRAATVSKPACLAAFTVSAAISSACKCLSVPTSTTIATFKTVVPAITTVTEGSIVTVTYTPTDTTTETVVAETSTIVTATHLETVTLPAPTDPVIIYDILDSRFKIQAIGSSATGQFLSAARDAPYTFGESANVFSGNDNNRRAPRKLLVDRSENTYLYRALADNPALGQMGPGIQGTFVGCSVTSEGTTGPKQICALRCQNQNSGAIFGWNCDGKLSSQDIGSCSSVQLYAVRTCEVGRTLIGNVCYLPNELPSESM